MPALHMARWTQVRYPVNRTESYLGVWISSKSGARKRSLSISVSEPLLLFRPEAHTNPLCLASPSTILQVRQLLFFIWVLASLCLYCWKMCCLMFKYSIWEPGIPSGEPSLVQGSPGRGVLGAGEAAMVWGLGVDANSPSLQRLLLCVARGTVLLDLRPKGNKYFQHSRFSFWGSPDQPPAAPVAEAGSGVTWPPDGAGCRARPPPAQARGIRVQSFLLLGRKWGLGKSYVILSHFWYTSSPTVRIKRFKH